MWYSVQYLDVMINYNIHYRILANTVYKLVHSVWDVSRNLKLKQIKYLVSFLSQGQSGDESWKNDCKLDQSPHHVWQLHCSSSFTGISCQLASLQAARDANMLCGYLLIIFLIFWIMHIALICIQLCSTAD